MLISSAGAGIRWGNFEMVVIVGPRQDLVRQSIDEVRAATAKLPRSAQSPPQPHHLVT